MFKQIRILAVPALVGALLLPATAFGDVPLGLNDFASRSPLGGINYSTTLPDWAGGAGSKLADSMTASMTGDWTGTALSEVWYLNGTDETGGLGFTYKFTVDVVGSESGLVRVSFDDTNTDWAATSFADVGADGTGESTHPGGSTGWVNGDPAEIERFNGVPAFNFKLAGARGTVILSGGQFSSVMFIETDAQTWEVNDASLIDGGADGDVPIFAVPEPTAVLLGSLGLAAIGLVRRRTH